MRPFLAFLLFASLFGSPILFATPNVDPGAKPNPGVDDEEEEDPSTILCAQPNDPPFGEMEFSGFANLYDLLNASPIHRYADECRCETGMMDGRHPMGLTETSGVEIPTYWNRKRISWDPLSQLFLFDGKQANPNNHYPEEGVPQSFTLPSAEQDSLKCDDPSMVGEGGTCVPGQRSYQGDSGDVRWSVLYRRLSPVNPGQKEWAPTHPSRFSVIASISYNKKTGGACFFDTNARGAARDEKKGIKDHPIPRPGGRDWYSTEGHRATCFWDPPIAVMNAKCVNCHSNGPLVGTQWLANTGQKFGYDDAFEGHHGEDSPYWVAANLFQDRKTYYHSATEVPGDLACLDCHAFWQLNGRANPTNPFGLSLVSITSSHAADATSGPSEAFVTKLMKASYYRSGVIDGHRIDPNLVGRPNTGKRDASVTHEMPKNYGGTTKEWEDEFRQGVTALGSCVAGASGPNGESPGNQCTGVKVETPPDFYGPQDRPPQSDFTHFIEPPDSFLEFESETYNCAESEVGKCYRLSFVDSRDPWRAANTIIGVGGEAPLSHAMSTSSYCKGPVSVDGKPQNEGLWHLTGSRLRHEKIGDGWRRRYFIEGPFQKRCSRVIARICASWCSDRSREPGSQMSAVFNEGCTTAPPQN